MPVLLPAPGEAIEAVASEYPPGTALLETPFVCLGGWQAARWAAILSFIFIVVVLARWLEEERLNPLFALLFTAYPRR